MWTAIALVSIALNIYQYKKMDELLNVTEAHIQRVQELLKDLDLPHDE